MDISVVLVALPLIGIVLLPLVIAIFQHSRRKRIDRENEERIERAFRRLRSRTLVDRAWTPDPRLYRPTPRAGSAGSGAALPQRLKPPTPATSESEVPWIAPAVFDGLSGDLGPGPGSSHSPDSSWLTPAGGGGEFGGGGASSQF